MFTLHVHIDAFAKAFECAGQGCVFIAGEFVGFLIKANAAENGEFVSFQNANQIFDKIQIFGFFLRMLFEATEGSG